MIMKVLNRDDLDNVPVPEPPITLTAVLYDMDPSA